MTDVKKVEVKASFISYASQLIEKITPDMIDTEILKPFENLVPDSGIVDCFSAGKYAEECLKAMSLCKLYAKVCQSFAIASSNKTKKLKALAFFAADGCLQQSGVKVTDKSKEASVDTDPLVVASRDVRGSWEVLTEYFENSLDEYRTKHVWYKEIFKKDMNSGDNQERA